MNIAEPSRNKMENTTFATFPSFYHIADIFCVVSEYAKNLSAQKKIERRW